MGNNLRALGLSTGAVLIIVISYFFIDASAARWFHALSQETRNLFEWITKAGVSTLYLIVAFGLFIFFRWIRPKRLYADCALLFFSNVALSGIVVNVVKFLVGRLRPKMLFEKGLYGFDPFRVGYEFNSFPSGHATTVFAIAVTCSIFWPKYRILFFTFAATVALSRLVLNAHYLSDVLAGACIGIATAVVMVHYIPVQSGLLQIRTSEPYNKDS
jgi:membrane-associated phospholipid phosphatase